MNKKAYKNFNYITSFIRVKFMRQRIPLFVGWNLTNKCNFDCKYCNVNELNKNEELSTKQVLAGVEQLSQMGTQRIHFGGGEVLLRDDLEEIIDFCRTKKIYTAILTNGYLFREKLNVIKKTDLVKISFDGPKAVHDLLRKEGSYDRIIEALKIAKKENINVALSVTISKYNADQIDSIIKSSKEFKVAVRFQLVNQYLAGKKNIDDLQLTFDRKYQVLSKILKEKKTNRYIIDSRAVLLYMREYPNVKKVLCCAGKMYIRVSSQGYLYLCDIKREYRSKLSYIVTGMKQAFDDILSIDCRHCLCTPTLELNYIYSLHLEPIVNAIKNNG